MRFQPPVEHGAVAAHLTDGGGPVFYSVDLDAPGQVTVPHTHSYVTETKAPTCTEPGQLIYRCGLCGYIYADCVAEPLGHAFADGVCVRCGASEAASGDVNGDGWVNAQDARDLLRYLAGLAETEEWNEAAADFNGDGRVNARDARAILRYIAQRD